MHDADLDFFGFLNVLNTHILKLENSAESSVEKVLTEKKAAESDSSRFVKAT